MHIKPFVSFVKKCIRRHAYIASGRDPGARPGGDKSRSRSYQDKARAARSTSTSVLVKLYTRRFAHVV